MEALRPTVTEIQQKSRRTSLMIGLAMVILSVAALFSRNIGLTALGGMMLLGGLVIMAPALVMPIARVFTTVLATTFAREGTGTLAEGNMTRQPGRAAITASATMIGLAIIVAMGGMIHSMTGNFLGVLERSLGSDYLLMPPSVGVWSSDVGAKETLAEDLRDIPGVDLVSTMRFAASSADGQAVSMLGIDPIVFPQVSSLTFQKGHPNAFGYIAVEIYFRVTEPVHHPQFHVMGRCGVVAVFYIEEILCAGQGTADNTDRLAECGLSFRQAYFRLPFLFIAVILLITVHFPYFIPYFL